MLAKVSSQVSSAEYELLSAPHSLSAQSLKAKLPFADRRCGPHNDGCGVAWLEDDSLRLKTRGRSGCWDSSFIGLAENLASTALIAHNRAASPGLVINRSAAHPYLGSIAGEQVAFCHNGGIRDLFAQASARRVTDSFIFLEHLSREIHVLDIGSLRGLLAACAKDWSYSSLNGLLLSSRGVFAWRCFEEGGPSGDINSGYYTLHIHSRSSGICIASEPVDRKHGWQQLPNRTLCELRSEGGTVVMRQARF